MNFVSEQLNILDKESAEFFKEIGNGNVLLRDHQGVGEKANKDFETLMKYFCKLFKKFNKFRDDKVNGDADLKFIEGLMETNFGNLSVDDETELANFLQEAKQNDITGPLILKLYNLVEKYMVLLNYDNLLTDIVNYNFKIIDNLNYFENLKYNNNLVSKLYYFLQIAPSLFYEILLKLRNTENIREFACGKFKEIKNTLYEFDISLNNKKFIINKFSHISRDSKTQLNIYDYVLKLFNYCKLLINYPNRLLNKYFISKVDNLKNLKMKNIEKLGKLTIDTLSIDESSKFDLHVSKLNQVLLDGNVTADSNESLLIVLQKNIKKYKMEMNESLMAKKPSNWPIYLILLMTLPNYSMKIYSNKDYIISWINENFVQAIGNLYYTWIKVPILNILNTVTHDDNSQISIMGKKSLSSDLDSLERMLMTYFEKLKIIEKSNSIGENLILQNIRDGDLTLFMKSYEEQINSPVRNLIMGDLIQSILIQVQKTKVDGDLVINGIDQLLKSQELVFKFIAILPTVMILISLISYLKNYVTSDEGSGGFSISKRNTQVLTMKNLNQIERLLIEMDGSNGANTLDYYQVGELLIEVLLLERNFKEILPANRLNEFKLDVKDLHDNKLSYDHKIKILNKIWRNYGYYLQN